MGRIFTVCTHCVAPKRHPGCHDRCPEYLAQKAINDELKEKEFKRKQIESGLGRQMFDGIQKALRHRGGK